MTYSFIEWNTISRTLYTLFLPLLLVISGCETITTVNVDPYPSLYDELFPEYNHVIIETEEDVFSINEDTKRFVHKLLAKSYTPTDKIETLAKGIFDHAELNLLYRNDANTVAQETFENKAANCLSLTIMTYAMAKYAGFGVHFQQVEIPEVWVRRGGSRLLNRHVNLNLYPKGKNNIIIYNSRSYQLDFGSGAQSLRLPTKLINKNRVLAMFYNNKGADALINGELNTAYAYFRQALITDRLLVEGWTNLGSLYSRAGHLDYAESSYKQALAISNKDSNAWENLAYIYSRTDRLSEAQTIKRRLLKQRKNNPFYHYMLGETEYDNQQWSKAIKHLRRAISIDNNQHEFYFALSKAYFQLGDIEHSTRFMKLAKRNTNNDRDIIAYQSKLDKLGEL